MKPDGIRPQARRVTGRMVHFPLTEEQSSCLWVVRALSLLGTATYLWSLTSSLHLSLREAGDHDTGISLIASCYSSKRHDTGELKTSMVWGYLWTSLIQIVDSVQCHHFLISWKVSGVFASTKLGPKEIQRDFFFFRLFIREVWAHYVRLPTIHRLWKLTPMSEAWINHGPSISRRPE